MKRPNLVADDKCQVQAFPRSLCNPPSCLLRVQISLPGAILLTRVRCVLIMGLLLPAALDVEIIQPRAVWQAGSITSLNRVPKTTE